MAIRTHLQVFDNTVGTFVKQLSSPAGCDMDNRAITLLHHSLHGLWVARHQCGKIALYHAKYHKHLLDVNIDSHVARFLAETSVDTLPTTVYVKSMQVIENVLWVGTNVGLVLSMQLPQSTNVPIMEDQMAVSYHGHLEEVNVILSLPSLRAHKEVKPEISDVDSLLIDKLYKNTRKPVRDFIATRLGIVDLDITFIDTPDDLNVAINEAHQMSQDATGGSSDEQNTSKYSMKQFAPDELDTTFTEVLENTDSTINATGVSQDDDDNDKNNAAKEDERKPGNEEAADNSTWAPNSMLIVTGGRGYIKRQHNINLNTSLQSSPRCQSTSNVAELSASWKMKTVDEKENLILWEKRLN
uniref:Uncharacterized protein n=1 Tax=Anopheles maculatus TaxID=74869 RepID=A0A182TBH1_9DIPT